VIPNTNSGHFGIDYSGISHPVTAIHNVNLGHSIRNQRKIAKSVLDNSGHDACNPFTISHVPFNLETLGINPRTAYNISLPTSRSREL
jgi:hypothetical protein